MQMVRHLLALALCGCLLPLSEAVVVKAGKAKRLALNSHIPGAPVNSSNALATQVVELYQQEDCQGDATSFTSSGNAFYADFGKYVKNLWSAKLCGKGTFFYFAGQDMDLLSTLGHISRCGTGVTQSTEECTCQTLEPNVRFLVQSFTLQYC
eukprot:TRINITY_DN564_c0_g1_i1.p1 TRINITY_DN564_c0_g1~~TRINITY_DN564_c0_g1_i1.p1  ORF type:complete len:152 (+),score=43.24 TRINITY_DN564_c0_g1_i1:243-698(+)